MDFSNISSQIAQSGLAQYPLKMLEELESEALFSIACNKDHIYRSKCGRIKNISDPKIHIIANNTNFGHVSSNISGHEINIMSVEMIKSPSNDNHLKESLRNSFVITTSNIFAEIGSAKFGALTENLLSTVFIIHDYDNHHWIDNNIQAAIFADIYAPAHQSDYAIASRVNPNILCGIPCGSNQWSKDFILNYGNQNLLSKRSSIPLGKYFIYEKFLHRNKVINTLSQTYPDIGFVDQDFHLLSPQEKWQEWSGYALHWIVPVLNDLPIRFFDSLITGGIPLVPTSLKPFIQSLKIPEEFYASYSPLDILDPKVLVKNQIERFNLLGEAGILRRHQFALEHFQVDAIIEKLIQRSFKLYGLE